MIPPRRSLDVVKPMWHNSSALLAAMPFPALIVSADSRVRAANTLARNLFNVDAVGRHYLTVLRQPQVSKAVEAVIAGDDHAEARLTDRSLGVDTHWHMVVSVIEALPEAESLRNVLVTFQDVTAVDAASKIRRDFVANVSHELRTPLTAILGFIETLRGAAKADPGARDRFLAIMEREGNRMLQLVDGLLSLSRVERNERVRPNERVGLLGLIEDVVTSLEPITERSGSRILVEVAPSITEIRGDPVQLGQLLRNLLHNALKYGGGDEGGEVTLKITGPSYDDTLRADCLFMSVSDRGPGIAAHHIPRLTERFYRADAHRSRDAGGSGLGLAIVKHIISRHRGRLQIESVLGEGSTFTAILPI